MPGHICLDKQLLLLDNLPCWSKTQVHPACVDQHIQFFLDYFTYQPSEWDIRDYTNCNHWIGGNAISINNFETWSVREREREREVTFTFIIPARTAPPRYTICFLRGGSSIRNRSFCSPLDIENIRGSSSIKKIGSIHNCCTTISGSLANHYLL